MVSPRGIGFSLNTNQMILAGCGAAGCLGLLVLAAVLAFLVFTGALLLPGTTQPNATATPTPTPGSNSSTDSMPPLPTGNSNLPTIPGTGGASTSGGALDSKAIIRPDPVYPQAARAVRAAGPVVVQISVNEFGQVTSATAVTGHPLLRQAAVDAAKQAQFAPTITSGRPSKVTGTITYNFVL